MLNKRNESQNVNFKFTNAHTIVVHFLVCLCVKVAYHFKCSDITGFYDKHFYELLFRKYLKMEGVSLSSKVLTGDLILGDIRDVDERLFVNRLVGFPFDTWKRISYDNAKVMLREKIFIICFETIGKSVAQQIHTFLKDEEHYLGAFEIDHSDELQWYCYGECIGPKFRILNKDLYIMVDNDDPEMREYAAEEKTFFEGLFFANVKIENSNYRYSVFDDHHNYEHARRGAEWRKSVDALFASISDEITGKLIDVAPDLTNKLWALTSAFDAALVGEQYAHVMTSCRRVFEYVTGCLFPATDQIIDGRSLKEDKYKNRLMAFATKQLQSKTNVEMIVSATATLFKEWEKLYALSNKGVHDETHRSECRRCIIRTVLLLDDIISLRVEPFQTNIVSDKWINDLHDKYK